MLTITDRQDSITSTNTLSRSDRLESITATITALADKTV